jgi:type IV pilus assembly protein PilX
MTSNRPICAPRRRMAAMPAQRQRGVVLFISLIVLVAMSLAGIAMFRQVTTGVTIAGNLAFKDNATNLGDLGIEDAVAWLTGAAPYGAPPVLNVDQAPGYKSCTMNAPPPAAGVCPWTNFDPTNFDWTNQAVQTTPDDGTGNQVQYVIHRLCAFPVPPQTGAPSDTPCVTFGSVGAGGSKGGGGYGVLPLTNTAQPYFRITSKVTGPRQTVSYVQVIMY